MGCGVHTFSRGRQANKKRRACDGTEPLMWVQSLPRRTSPVASGWLPEILMTYGRRCSSKKQRLRRQPEAECEVVGLVAPMAAAVMATAAPGRVVVEMAMAVAAPEVTRVAA
eukprot:4693777-Prymnesium_polylepis.1